MIRALIYCGILMCCAPARADDVALLLARVAVNEAGFDSLADADAIAVISLGQARRSGLAPDVWLRRRYLRALATVERRRNRPWIAALTRSPDEPAGWPGTQPWAVRAPQWARLLARMDAIVSGRAHPRCSAQTWGGPMDAENIARIIARGGRVVSCGRTRNVFLRFGS